MFTAAEFRLIRENCPAQLNALLKNLNIPIPDWQSGDEFALYEKLDDAIVKQICRRLKSESVIEGYTNLMTLGGLHFDYSETDNELLTTILQNQETIQARLQNKISAPPPEIPKEIFDYSNVEIEFARADFTIGISMPGKKNFELRNRKILNVPPALKNQIRDLICEYFRQKESFNVVEAVEVSIKTRNGTPDEYHKKKYSAPQKFTPQPARKPPLTQEELTKVFASLKLVEDIVKSI